MTISAIIRSKIDYGSIVYGAANAATLKSLEVVANEAMRITSGAFKNNPSEQYADYER